MEALKDIRNDLEKLKIAVEELKIAVDIEPEVRPEYLKKLMKIDKEGNYGKIFNSVEELDEYIKSNV